MNDKELLKHLPILPTKRNGKRLTPKELKKLIEFIRKSEEAKEKFKIVFDEPLEEDIVFGSLDAMDMYMGDNISPEMYDRTTTYEKVDGKWEEM